MGVWLICDCCGWKMSQPQSPKEKRKLTSQDFSSALAYQPFCEKWIVCNFFLSFFCWTLWDFIIIAHESWVFILGLLYEKILTDCDQSGFSCFLVGALYAHACMQTVHLLLFIDEWGIIFLRPFAQKVNCFFAISKSASFFSREPSFMFPEPMQWCPG